MHGMAGAPANVGQPGALPYKDPKTKRIIYSDPHHNPPHPEFIAHGWDPKTLAPVEPIVGPQPP